MNEEYKNKYLKYKTKYLQLKNSYQTGGKMNDEKINKEILALYAKYYLSPKKTIENFSLKDITNYYSNIKKYTLDKQTIIDIKIKYDSNFEKLASITNYFVLPVRMKCLVEGQKYTPYELYLQEKENGSNISRYQLKKILKKSCTLLNFTRIIYILNLLCPNNKNIKYIDSSSGWGDRLIGALMYGVSEYRGYDPNTALISNYHNIKKYFNKNNLCGKYRKSFDKTNFDIEKFSVIPKPFEIDYDDEKELINYFDICISSPPFFTFEKYSDEDTQSIYSDGKVTSVTSWLEGFLYPSFKKLLKLIKSEGYICWYIEDKPEYKFIDIFINYCKKLECSFYGKIGFGYDDANEIRYFLVFKKL